MFPRDEQLDGSVMTRRTVLFSFAVLSPKFANPDHSCHTGKLSSRYFLEEVVSSMKRQMRLGSERLERRRYLTLLGFAGHEIDEPETAGSLSMIMADLDSDGDRDLISNNVWRPNDGTGTFGRSRQMFTNRSVGQMLAADLDRDGDVDLVVSSSNDTRQELAWFENVNGRGRLGPERLIASQDRRATYTKLIGADVDGDGHIDVMESDANTTRVFSNSDGRGTLVLAYEWTDLSDPVVEDIDHDGDKDIVASRSNASLQLLENQGGSFHASTLHPESGPLAIGDVNGDGTLDFILGEYDGVRWYEWDPASREMTLKQTVRHLELGNWKVRKIALEDMDLDGDMDLVSGMTTDSGSVIPFIESFVFDGTRYDQVLAIRPELPYQGMAAFCFCDVTGDDAADLVTQTAVRRFSPQVRQFLEPTYFLEDLERSNTTSLLADIDADGDLDAAFADYFFGCFQEAPVRCEGRISWFENLDGQGIFSNRRTLQTGISGRIEQLFASDVDGDLDLDILWSEANDDGVQWLENADGQGGFSESRLLARGSLLAVDDVDQDGHADLVTQEDDQVVVSFRDGGRVVVSGRSVESSPLRDWDTDGDLDLLVGENSTIYVHDYVGGRVFAPARVILTDAAFPNGYQFQDLDQDGDQDLLWTTFLDVTLVWQENLATDRWGTLQPIAPRTRALTAIDVDRDGDRDVIAYYAPVHQAFYLNDGRGNFTRAPVLVNLLSNAWGDIDLDGDLDTLALDGYWYEQTTPGDANGDGLFNSSDLVAVWQAGEYEDWIEANSIFQTGDWNGDGDFDSSDLVLAFQLGAYESEIGVRKA